MRSLSILVLAAAIVEASFLLTMYQGIVEVKAFSRALTTSLLSYSTSTLTDILPDNSVELREHIISSEKTIRFPSTTG